MASVNWRRGGNFVEGGSLAEKGRGAGPLRRAKNKELSLGEG